MQTSSLRFAGQPLPKVRGEKSEMLMEFLVENRGQRFERKHLEAAFWPDKAPTQAQQSLRQALFKISSAFSAESPIVSKRTVVYCRASDIYEAKSAEKAEYDYHSHGVETQIHADFGSLRIDQFLTRITTRYTAADTATREFYLACAYNELGLESSAIEVANRMMSRAATRSEQVNANHAMGAMLWHAGEFDAGLKLSWEAAHLADVDSPVGQHIVSNIAIGEHERGSRDGFEYALSRLRLADEAYSSILKNYLLTIHLTQQKDFFGAERVARTTLSAPDCARCRIKVYFLELLANALHQQKREKESKQVMANAAALRELYAMHPSRIEARRLGKLRQALGKG